MICELSEEHFNTMTLDELRGLYAEAKRQTGLARPHTQGYGRAIAAIGRIAEAIAAREALMHVLIPRPRRVAAPSSIVALKVPLSIRLIRCATPHDRAATRSEMPLTYACFDFGAKFCGFWSKATTQLDTPENPVLPQFLTAAMA